MTERVKPRQTYRQFPVDLDGAKHGFGRSALADGEWAVGEQVDAGLGHLGEQVRVAERNDDQRQFAFDQLVGESFADRRQCDASLAASCANGDREYDRVEFALIQSREKARDV